MVVVVVAMVVLVTTAVGIAVVAVVVVAAVRTGVCGERYEIALFSIDDLTNRCNWLSTPKINLSPDLDFCT